MTINYTSLLGLAEPVTGTESGTWGDDVNKGLTDYLDIAISGTQTISGSQTAVTLSLTNGSSAASNIAQAGAGATGSAQFAIINCTGNPAGTLTVTVPASSRNYIVINGTSTSQSVKIVGAGPTTGVTIPSGQKALVAWNGSDFVQVGASAGGANTQVQYNSSGALAGSANLTFDGTTLTANTLVAGAIVSTRINPRVSSTTSTASITPDISAYDQYCVTAQAATLTINAPIGTPVDGNKLMFRILDNGGSQTLTWNATFTAIGVTLPTATTASKMTYVGCIYNSTNTRWDVVAVTTQA